MRRGVRDGLPVAPALVRPDPPPPLRSSRFAAGGRIYRPGNGCRSPPQQPSEEDVQDVFLRHFARLGAHYDPEDRPGDRAADRVRLVVVVLLHDAHASEATPPAASGADIATIVASFQRRTTVINITQTLEAPGHHCECTRSTASSLLPRNGPLPRRAVSFKPRDGGSQPHGNRVKAGSARTRAVVTGADRAGSGGPRTCLPKNYCRVAPTPRRSPTGDLRQRRPRARRSACR
jgi:hypothetical protein